MTSAATFQQEVNQFVAGIGKDITAGVQWVEGETKQALETVWGYAKPIFVQAEPVVVQGLLTELSSFLGSASDDVKDGELSYIATTFLATLKDTGHVLAGDAENLGMDLLTVLAGLAKNAAAKV